MKPAQTPIERAFLSLDGLSVGDGFGQRFFFVTHLTAESRLERLFVPPPPWFFTDYTVMAVSIVRSLAQHGRIDPDRLATAFADEYRREPDQGYGGTARGILQAIGEGVPWQEAAGRVFDGDGSCGNGGAMRAAPIGAYFADDIQRVIQEARKSAAMTHAHEDGQTGAIAVALAATWIVDHVVVTNAKKRCDSASSRSAAFSPLTSCVSTSSVLEKRASKRNSREDRPRLRR